MTRKRSHITFPSFRVADNIIHFVVNRLQFYCQTRPAGAPSVHVCCAAVPLKKTLINQSDDLIRRRRITKDSAEALQTGRSEPKTDKLQINHGMYKYPCHAGCRLRRRRGQWAECELDGRNVPNVCRHSRFVHSDQTGCRCQAERPQLFLPPPPPLSGFRPWHDPGPG